ncbi:MAG: lipocalin [Zetaproteobacteria bacterium CG2_30_46_52]|nr:MAG: lipocalin [Zetaproteobacteria bacterium CG2_30_46_52]
MRLLAFFGVLLLSSCVSLPTGVTPVQDFSLQRYLGTWYEVARLDHSFERGLSHVTATYSLREDGGVRVINRGYSAEDKVWEEAEGKAYFVRQADEGYLKVSFFGPFYGAYIIFSLDKDYAYSFVSGPDTDYLWLLSRTPEVSESVKADFINQAAALGFDTSALIFPNQLNPPKP